MFSRPDVTPGGGRGHYLRPGGRRSLNSSPDARGGPTSFLRKKVKFQKIIYYKYTNSHDKYKIHLQKLI